MALSFTHPALASFSYLVVAAISIRSLGSFEGNHAGFPLHSCLLQKTTPFTMNTIPYLAQKFLNSPLCQESDLIVALILSPESIRPTASMAICLFRTFALSNTIAHASNRGLYFFQVQAQSCHPQQEE
jgi:hypothetical protein